MYEYKAEIYKVVDGDTIKAKVDLGFSIFHDTTFRLLGINTSEMNSKDVADKERAKLATKRLSEMVLGKVLTIKTTKDKKDKYGRYLVSILLENKIVNDILLEEGLAEKYNL